MRLASPTVQQGRLKGQLTGRSRYRRDEQHSTTARSVRTNSCYAAKVFVNGSCKHKVLRVKVEAKCCQHLLHGASSGVRWGAHSQPSGAMFLDVLTCCARITRHILCGLFHSTVQYCGVLFCTFSRAPGGRRHQIIRYCDQATCCTVLYCTRTVSAVCSTPYSEYM